MKTLRGSVGFSKQPYFKQEEIEQLCNRELQETGLFPLSPAPVRIERFIEKRFGITPEYGELPEGVLGYTRFGQTGVEGMVISRRLSEEASKVAERRINTTLAHEAGHGLLHTYLFVLDADSASLFDHSPDATPGKVLCREDRGSATGKKTYSGRWWEYQANCVMGSILLPRKLIAVCLASLLEKTGLFETTTLPVRNRDAAVRLISETFDVNHAVATIRVGQLFAAGGEKQLTL